VPRMARGRREAAVLVPVYRDAAGGLRIVLVRRSETGIHGGQLAFPGGRREVRDRSLLETALREAEEEIGLAPAAVTVLAELPVVETITSNHRIAPFLAHIVPPARWRLQASEVAEVIEARVADLLDPEARGESIEHFPTWPRPRRIQFYRVGRHRLWGASYRIAEPLLARLAAGEWEV